VTGSSVTTADLLICWLLLYPLDKRLYMDFLEYY